MRNFGKFLGIKVPDTETTLDKEKILKSAISFAEYLTTDLWPQVEVVETKGTGTVRLWAFFERRKRIETRLRYYLCGSLATMLLAGATSFTEIDGTQLPALVEVCTIAIPESARAILASFARQIVDVDYVPINYDGVELTRSRKVSFGPSLDEIPEAGRTVFRQDRGRVGRIMFDPVGVYGIIGVAKVSVGEQDYYIASPTAMLGYKVLHLLRKYEEKPEKLDSDLRILLNAMKKMYNEEELIQIIRKILAHYEEANKEWFIQLMRPSQRLNAGEPRPYQNIIPRYIERVLANQQLSPEIRDMLKSLR